MTGLARCVGDVRGFLDHHWAQAPVHRPGADASAFADLFSLDDVDRLVSSSSPRLPTFRLVKDGKPLDPSRYTRTARVGGQSVSGMGDAGRIFEEFRAGATIVFQGLHRSCLPLTRFCRALELDLSHAVQANAYVTPAGSRGLGVHYDTHDVFVLQLAGSKAWSIYPPVLEDPLPSQPWKGTAADAGEPIMSVELQAGDVLYVPRGFLHSARAQEALSTHRPPAAPAGRPGAPRRPAGSWGAGPRSWTASCASWACSTTSTTSRSCAGVKGRSASSRLGPAMWSRSSWAAARSCACPPPSRR
jgi:lysine-specific demethylase/histidyl-hydroxylase NO66